MTPIRGRMGSPYRPGDVPYGHLDFNIPMELPVLGGQVIAKGDIVTLSPGPGQGSSCGERGYAMRAESIGEGGAARNWGDVSRGAFMALRHVDSSGAASGAKSIPVMPPFGQITTFLDGGITTGSLVGVDLRIDTGAERLDRHNVVSSTYSSHNERNIGQLWQQARLIPYEQSRDPVMRKALLGRVERIFSPRGTKPAVKSQHNDCGLVWRLLCP